jgi:hypothetical protein
VQGPYGDCGGLGHVPFLAAPPSGALTHAHRYTGPTTCVPGYTCVDIDGIYESQCLPITASSTTTPTLTTAPTSSIVTTTTTTTAASTTTTGAWMQGPYGDCGGLGHVPLPAAPSSGALTHAHRYTGPTTCVPGYTCVDIDGIYESQCLPITASSTNTQTSTTAPTSTIVTTTTTSSTTTTTQLPEPGWGQCGGLECVSFLSTPSSANLTHPRSWTGATVCAAGFTCVDLEHGFFSQCIPNAKAPTP